MIPYNITADHIVVVIDSVPYTTRRGTDASRYVALREAVLREDWDDVVTLACPGKGIDKWSNGQFKFANNCISYNGEVMPDGIQGRMLAMASAGDSPEPLMRFWERLQLNPSARSVEQLFSFLDHVGIPIDVDGMILAYKGVRLDYMDVHSGTFRNVVGAKFSMPRNRISDDPRTPCAEGFHVGAKEYATSFGQRVMIVSVDPANVVCIPYDSSCQKMRLCAYSVIAEAGADLPSTAVQLGFFTDDEDGDTLPDLSDSTESSSSEDDLPSELEEMSLRELRILAVHKYKIAGAGRLDRAHVIRRILEVTGGIG